MESEASCETISHLNSAMDKIWYIPKENQFKEASFSHRPRGSCGRQQDDFEKFGVGEAYVKSVGGSSGSGCVGALLCCSLTPFCFAFLREKESLGFSAWHLGGAPSAAVLGVVN